MPDCRYQLENYRNQNETKMKKAKVEGLFLERMCTPQRCSCDLLPWAEKNG